MMIKKPNRGKGSNTAQPFYNKKRVYTSKGPMSEEQKVHIHYQGQNDLGNGVYAVEMFTNQFQELIIESKHLQAPDKYRIEIANDKVQSLCVEFG